MAKQPKVKMASAKYHVDTNGISSIGELDGISEYSLTTILGEPEYPAGDGKTTKEWNGTIDGEVFSIYDYNYEGDVEQCMFWRIGGIKSGTADKVQAYIRAELAKIETKCEIEGGGLEQLLKDKLSEMAEDADDLCSFAEYILGLEPGTCCQKPGNTDTFTITFSNENFECLFNDKKLEHYGMSKLTGK